MAFTPDDHRDPLGRRTLGEWHATPMAHSRAAARARATSLRRPDLIERDAMVAALQALGTERLRSMLDWAERHPRNKERWDSLTVAGVQMIVDPDLLRAELARRG